MNIDEAKKRIEYLKKLIKKYDYEYYVLSSPTISDYVYDNLYSELKSIEAKFPELITPDSPTQRVSEKPLKGFEKIEHKPKMYSLDNTYSDSELINFDNRIKNIINTDYEYTIEPKIDGVAVSIIYTNGFFTTAISRGNGNIGDNITNNIKTINELPLKLYKKYPGEMIIRGEVFFTKKRFAEIKDEYSFINARNAASGTLKLLDSNEVKNRQLSIRIHSVITKLKNTHYETLLELKKLGIPVIERIEIAKNIEEVIKIKNQWEQTRHNLPYETDGIVIKINDLNLREQIGFTNKSPRWAFAFKYKPETAITKVVSVDFQVGRTGIITPVANLEAVFISGTTVKRATLHNFDEIKRLDLYINDYVEIEKSGEIIPKIIKVIKNKRNKDQIIKIDTPDKCPSCNSPLIQLEDEVAIRCINVNCPAQIEQKLIYFASKQCMDIEYMGPALIKQLLENNLISHLSDIYKLTKNDLMNLERMGEKSSENIINAIEKSKNVPLGRFINALGIRNVGEYTSQLLAERFENLDKLKSATKDELIAIDGIGDEVADSIIKFFENKENINEIDLLFQLGIKPYINRKEKKLNNLKFVITGTLKNYSRDEIKDIIILNGGKVSNTVSKNTNYLILGENPGSKFDKAKKLNVKIINEEEFKKLLGE